MVKRRVIRVSSAHAQRIGDIRTFLAEQGYKIFPVAKWFRRHTLDFIAIYSDHPRKLLLVRPAKKGITEFLFYSHRIQYFEIRNALKVRKKVFGRMHWVRQLPSMERQGGLKMFVPRRCKKEFELLCGEEVPRPHLN